MKPNFHCGLECPKLFPWADEQCTNPYNKYRIDKYMQDIAFNEKNPKIQNYVQFFGLSSPKKRYFIPSKKNYFDRIQFPFCMLDTGCRTHLLPIDDNIRTTIFAKYSDKGLYNWRVMGRKGSVRSPKLIIEKTISGKIHC